MAQLVVVFNEKRLDLLGVTETHLPNCSKTHVSVKTFLLSGRKDDTHRQGVGLMLSPRAEKCLTEWEPINERLLRARFKSAHGKATIIVCYAPTETSEDTEKDEFYNTLQDVWSRLPEHDTKLLLGDLNAQLGENNNLRERVMGCHGTGRLNNNGMRFAQFCEINNLFMSSTRFQHANIHKYTWISPNGLYRSQIDHLAVSKNQRGCILDVKVSRLADIDSDHYLTIARWRVKLKKSNPQQKTKKRFNHARLKDSETKRAFKLELRNRFDALTECEDPEKLWQKFRTSIKEFGENQLTNERRDSKKDWISDQTWQLIQERNSLKGKMEQQRKTRQTTEKYREKAREVKTSAKNDKNKWFDNLAREAQECADKGNMRELFRKVKQLSGTAPKKVSLPVKDNEGNLITDEKAQNERWKEHFKTIQNRPAPTIMAEIEEPVDNLTVPTHNFTIEEVQKATQMMKNNKSPGMDLITAEILKEGGEEVAKWLLRICNGTLTTKEVPTDWRNGIIVKLPKKWDLTDPNNWRGVTLLSVPGKVFVLILLNRLKSTVDAKMREEQAGFRPGRSCTEQILAIRRIVEKTKEYQQEVHFNFIDFEKAFDSVDRSCVVWNSFLLH